MLVYQRVHHYGTVYLCRYRKKSLFYRMSNSWAFPPKRTADGQLYSRHVLLCTLKRYCIPCDPTPLVNWFSGLIGLVFNIHSDKSQQHYRKNTPAYWIVVYFIKSCCAKRKLFFRERDDLGCYNRAAPSKKAQQNMTPFHTRPKIKVSQFKHAGFRSSWVTCPDNGTYSVICFKYISRYMHNYMSQSWLGWRENMQQTPCVMFFLKKNVVSCNTFLQRTNPVTHWSRMVITIFLLIQPQRLLPSMLFEISTVVFRTRYFRGLNCIKTCCTD